MLDGQGLQVKDGAEQDGAERRRRCRTV